MQECKPSHGTTQTSRVNKQGRIVVKWFKHDSNAYADAKLKKVRMKYGMKGYGLYWYCLELICSDFEKSNITFELEHDAEIIAFDTGINVELVNEMMSFMINLELFESSEGKITCLKMAKRFDSSMTSNPQFRKMIDNMRHSHDGIMTKSDLVMQEKNITEDNITKKPIIKDDGQFTLFWNNYPKKVDKKQAEQKFNRLKWSDQNLAILDCAVRFKDTPKHFVPSPRKYIIGENWNDEIINNTSGQNNETNKRTNLGNYTFAELFHRMFFKQVG